MMSPWWFKKQMLSYLPLLLLIIFVLLAGTFLTLTQQSKKDIVRANGVFAEHVQQVVDFNLKSVENQLLHSALQNDTIKSYFHEKELGEGYFHKYETLKELDKIKVSNPLIDSLYLYRTQDESVLSDTMYLSLEQHGEKAFISNWLKENEYDYKWSDTRTYRGKYADQTGQVVSLVSNYPPPLGQTGLIVVNVRVSELKQLVDSMNAAADISSAHLIGTNGEELFAPSGGEKVEILHRYVSDYTGWEIQTGIRDRSLYSFSSGLFSLMLGIAVILLILGIAWIIYTSRSQYKPIHTIMQRIVYFRSAKHPIFQQQPQQTKDELKFIEEAFQQLTTQVLEYEKEQEEGLTFKRRHTFRELTAGNMIWNREEWDKEAVKLKVDAGYEEIAVAIAEVDHHADFSSKYSTRDQYLFQFVLNSVLREMAEQQQAKAWAEWLEGHRMTILLFHKRSTDEAHAEKPIASGLEHKSAAILAELSAWVKKNLDFTISIGVSRTITDTEQLYLIHSEAQEALNDKFINGSGRVIEYKELNVESHREVYKLMPKIRSFTHAYRIGEERWKDELQLLFQDLAVGGFAKNDVYYLINHIIHMLRREMMELSEEVQTLWSNEMYPALERILGGMETIEETRQRLAELFSEMDERLVEHRESRKHYNRMQEVRHYIEQHYANPELSLNALEERFGISGKYMSALFRDEIGDKFVDYLTKLRVGHAEKQLMETNETVQQIAVQVGYTNPMTFIRSFKKHYGMTPGDYRKQQH
ncbi:helix-turn-helix domain-containing protein [Paenibacillus agaridevorans]|uniref:helix-turn-helix domain-containing protein n=1 Tax=Paenibacillus agaridevorans TaxID=171404 RepID=UPI001BE4AA7B|nr:AraC family transcriptional regulator [Paenibacillus agaridevorans]